MRAGPTALLGPIFIGKRRRTIDVERVWPWSLDVGLDEGKALDAEELEENFDEDVHDGSLRNGRATWL